MVPATHMISDKPTLPDRAKMADGVAKIPVPIMRLRIKKTAEVRPMVFRSSLVSYTSPASSMMTELRLARSAPACPPG